MTDFADWQQPQAAANAIAATGAPLLRFTNNQGNGASTNLPANSATTLINLATITQPGYEGTFQLFAPAGSGTVPFARLDFNWTDQASGLLIGARHFFLTAGNGPTQFLKYYLSGPCKGNQLTVIANNLDPAVAMTLTWTINQVSHVYANDRIHQPVYAATAPNGYTNPGGEPAAGDIALSRPTVPINTTITRLAAVYGGRAVWSVDDTAGTAGLVAALIDPVATGSGLYGVASGRLATIVLGASSAQTVLVHLPYGPVNIQLVNASTTVAVTPNVGLVACDY